MYWYVSSSHRSEPYTERKLGATIAGLLPRSLLKSEARYSLRYIVNGTTSTDSRELRTRGRALAWSEVQDHQHMYACQLFAGLGCH
jgi:hypothetical protein